MTRQELDRAIESWFESRWNCKLDFEIDDALHKLVVLGLVEQAEDRLSAVSLDQGIRILDHRWDNYFVPEPVAS